MGESSLSGEQGACLSQVPAEPAPRELLSLAQASCSFPRPFPLCVLMRSQHLAAVYHHVELRNRACDDFLEGDSVV